MAPLSCPAESYGISQNDQKAEASGQTASILNTPVIQINSKNADGIPLVWPAFFDLSASSSRGDEKQKGPGLTAVSLLDSGCRGSAFMIKVKQTGGG